MNEELKIIIKAVTDNAKKGIKDVNGQLKGLESGGGKASAAMAAVSTAMKVVAGAAVAVVTSVIAVGAAILKLGKSTLQLNTQFGKLNTAFEASGSSAAQAAQTYKELFRYLGDTDKATEAAAHLAKITTNQQELSQWTKITQGVYASFGDSLPIEGLTEAANETMRVGKVTGVMADALNWAGASEEDLNAQLQSTTSLEEREALLRNTLNGLYEDAAELYERNNAAILNYNESQANLDISMANAGKAVLPLMTSLNNLSATFFNALAPALNAIIPYIAAFVDKIAQAVNWVLKFFNVLSGGKSATTAVSTSINSAAGGAGTLAKNTDSAAKAAQKLKRTTQGFDELNVVSNNASSSGSSGGGASGGGGGIVSGGIDTTALDTSLTETESKLSGFVERLKAIVQGIKDLFQPSIDAWKEAFNSVDWAAIGETFWNGILNIKNAYADLFTYIALEFVPSVTNAFSTNLAPVLADVFGTALTEGGKNFEFMTDLLCKYVNDILIPLYKTLGTVWGDVCQTIGDKWKTYGKPITENVVEAFSGIREIITNLYNTTIKPIADKIISMYNRIWKETLKPLWDNIVEAALDIVNNILLIWNKTLQPLINWLVNFLAPTVNHIVDVFLEYMRRIIQNAKEIINGLITAIRGIVNFLTGVFTLDWRKAWEGIKQIFKGIFESLVGVIKVPLNSIISGVNAVIQGIVAGVNIAIRAINKLSFTVPDWVPNIGGKKFGFNIKELSAPYIPALAKGGIVDSATLALIGEKGKEAVVPLENNTGWIDMLVDRLTERNNTPSKLVLMLDSRELGWANIQSINGITKQTGKLQLQLV